MKPYEDNISPYRGLQGLRGSLQGLHKASHMFPSYPLTSSPPGTVHARENGAPAPAALAPAVPSLVGAADVDEGSYVVPTHRPSTPGGPLTACITPYRLVQRAT